MEEKKNMDICLVSPPGRAYNHYRPPMALLYLAAYLSSNNINVSIIDPKSSLWVSTDSCKDEIISQIIKNIDDCKPRIVGIGCYTNEYMDVLNLAKRIKLHDSSIKIIVGGVHPTLKPQDLFFPGSPFDFIVIGEGEQTLYELVKALKLGNSIQNIKGIAYFDNKNQQIVTNSPRPLLQDLDSLPFPDFRKIDMSYYTSPNPYAVRGVFLSAFYILITRGCPSSCTFCVNKNLREYSGGGQYFRHRSAKNVLDELILLKKTYKIDGFYIIDDAFTLKKELVEDICRGIIKNKLNLLWGCSTKISAVTYDLLRIMKKAGCVQIDFGVESGSDEILLKMKKGSTREQIKKAFKLCHDSKIRTFANILINFPEETRNNINETLTLLEEIKPEVTSFNIFIPYLGTDIYNQYSINLAKEEYYKLGLSPLELINEPRFIFAKHDINFKEFYAYNHKKFNKLFRFFAGNFNQRYLGTLLKSKRKSDYFKQLPVLLKELLLQKNVK